MEKLEIRKMLMKDIPSVIEIEKQCFPIPWTRGAFETELKKNKLAIYRVATWENQVVGYGGMWFIVDEGHITNIAIHPNFQGRGIGEAIVRALMEEANIKRIYRMTLEVRKSNLIAQNLYKKLGFISCGIRPGYYSDNGEDALIMWKEI
ncbi:ribosomal protein S18-alanine N-acetyltransferase [Clostridium formicaceticum]|uniref:[Ribosomal protein bS18]-alanine N-acetyltransferase n=1 Tax=Clostridium formicaceticum TaxID=1497 RepID=A0AAC9RHA6_9CLOT|nr:ribosomal protein S18-alanine N-acetyltransferase [Clostridium formicaceticum]AOY75731.1 ribosomal-protein-alanine N-acetyltransferase [Clostridium formicaceticum]ARE86051.1 Acetyltransferase YpeA [Clostridium formicaceticum]